MKLNVYRLVNRLFTGNFIDFNCLNKNINPPHQCSTNRRNSFQICPFCLQTHETLITTTVSTDRITKLHYDTLSSKN